MTVQDQYGLCTYYDYSNCRLQWSEMDARADPERPARSDNVSKHHRINYAIAGGEAGLQAIADGSKAPWLYVHGGPGGGFSPDDHRMVDPDHYVPVMVLQRGAAGSGREGIMQDVSVDHFMVDYLDVLAHLNIRKAYWTGGSWGTTLVLKLLLEHPRVFVKMPTLRGLWLPSVKDLQFS